MAKVSVKVSGGELQLKDAATLGELKAMLNVPNFTGAINGDTAENSEPLTEGDYVTLAEAVKGA